MKNQPGPRNAARGKTKNNHFHATQREAGRKITRSVQDGARPDEKQPHPRKMARGRTKNNRIHARWREAGKKITRSAQYGVR
ncbi:hypothetical protein KKF97_18040 [Myxococcota bacterium]|nr:hypothetical protein [Myxococcota bacterium]